MSRAGVPEGVATHSVPLSEARLFQEHGNVLRHFAEKARQRGHNEVAERYEAQAGERDQDAAELRHCLTREPEPSASRR